MKSAMAEQRIVAWMSVRKRDGRYQLCEFGYGKNNDFTVAASVQHLLPMSLQVIANEQNGEFHKVTFRIHFLTYAISLHMPTIVCKLFLDMDETIKENDDS